MPKKKQTKSQTEPDTTFFLKLVLYIILGSFWLKFQQPLQIGSFMLNGFASHDHFQIDRKIEYTVLVLVTIVTFFLPAGIII